MVARVPSSLGPDGFLLQVTTYGLWSDAPNASRRIRSLPRSCQPNSAAGTLANNESQTPPVAGVTSVTLPGVTTPPVSKPTATKKILESETRSDLSVSELKKIICDIEQKYTGKQVIKFNASWIVEE